MHHSLLNIIDPEVIFTGSGMGIAEALSPLVTHALDPLKMRFENTLKLPKKAATRNSRGNDKRRRKENKPEHAKSLKEPDCPNAKNP